MIPTDSVRTLIGSNAYGPDGEKLGTIRQIYLDNHTNAPEWATLMTGLFGMRESFVPLREVELSGDGVRLPYGKDRIKGAPSTEADRDISPEEETALYEYYGLPLGQASATSPGVDPVGRPARATTSVVRRRTRR